MDEATKSTKINRKFMLMTACLSVIFAVIIALSWVNINNDRELNNTYVQIIAEAVKVRSAPDNSSSIIANIKGGVEILLINTVTGANGDEWYKIAVGDKTGYIRSDLAIIVE